MQPKHLLPLLIPLFSTAVAATHTGQFLHDSGSWNPTAMVTADAVSLLFIMLGGLLVLGLLIYLTGRVDFWNAIVE